MEEVLGTGWLACPACEHKEHSEHILYKMYEAEDKEVPIMEGVQVECTCRKCYFSWYMMPLNVGETTH